MLTQYFFKHHTDRLTEILNAPDNYLHYSIWASFIDVYEYDNGIAIKIIHCPREMMPLCDCSIAKAQQLLATAEQTVKRRVHLRVFGIPADMSLGCVGELKTMIGITVRISQPTVLKLAKRFECRKCKHVMVIKLEWERQMIADIKECKACHSRSISVLASLQQEDCADYQEIKIQEKCQMEKNNYTLGLQVILTDDLVDKCRPGDLVEMSGYVIRRWRIVADGRREDIPSITMANSLLVQRRVSNEKFSSSEIKETFRNYWVKYNDNPLLGRDNIVASICPQIFGMYVVKLALAVVLAGGVAKTSEKGSRVRGEPHLLLIGDPGTGKSQLLRASARLAVRSVLTTGIGTTAAGLTAAVVKDTDGWHLEGGALVLADGGVCCVDEFTTMNSHDRGSLHEAMEQQTISIAKAGLVSTLNSRCTVVAAINPIGGKFVDGEEIKTRLGNPLLSRFDLILILKDNKNVEWNHMICDHMLKAACEKSGNNQSKTDSKQHMDLLKSEGLWKEESLREYLAHVHYIKPVMTRDAEKILSAVFLYHRSDPNRREERTTIRLLDSLIRLAEGHARLMYRSEVNSMDAIVAARLVSTHPSTSDNIGCPFPIDPLEFFHREATELLQRLGLENLLGSL